MPTPTSFTDTYTILGGELGEQDLATLLLTNRGIIDTQDFLNPQYESLHEPSLMKGMTQAVERITHAIDNQEKILIFSDFDADGVPGAVVLSDFFKKIGYENYEVYIPNRNTEGFGLNTVACEQFIHDGVQLVITIDCGISNISEVALLREGGVEVIITDHHLPSAEGLPDAIIVDPKQVDCTYPFKDLCGSGVVFKLVQALLTHLTHVSDKCVEGIPDGWEKWLLDMVGIATICDMVPLVGENRTLAYYGLRVLQKSPRAGLKQILTNARVNQSTLTAQDVAFTLGPRINAASRIGDPRVAFRALSESGEEGVSAALELEAFNRKRKTVVAQAAKLAYKKADAHEESNVIVVGNTEWQPGIVGLIAGHISAKYAKPAFVWTRVGEEYRGSVRSGGVCSINELMNQSPLETFLSFGGHDAAGGFVCNDTQIHRLPQVLEEAYHKCPPLEQKKKPIDAELSLDHVTLANWQVTTKLEPYGMANTAPQFSITNIEIHKVRLFGADHNHISLSFKSAQGKIINAVRFNHAELIPTTPVEGQRVSLVVSLEMNTYNGSSELRLRIEDVCM